MLEVYLCRSELFYRACFDLYYPKQASSFHPLMGIFKNHYPPTFSSYGLMPLHG